MADPVVSIVIINWNHRHHLKTCLDALLAQEYPGLEIIVVDNASADGSVEWLTGCYPQVRLLAFSENRGFAPAFNEAARYATGVYLLSLNPDVTVQPGFIDALVAVMGSDDRIGILAPKLLWVDNPTLLDSTGLFIDRSRQPYDRGQGCVDQQQFDLQNEVFGACGAAAFYRRTMLEDTQIGGQFLDSDFFAYYEDADLSWRAQLKGWRCLYVPQAVAFHERGWGDTLRKRRAKNDYGPRLALRNRYLMTLKNDDLVSFLIDLPLILAREVPRLVYMAFVFPVYLLGLIDFFSALPDAFKKRAKIQSGRRVGSAGVRQWFVSSHQPLQRK